jgi:hypothetical protein
MPRRPERILHSPPDGLSGSRRAGPVGALASAAVLMVGTAMFVVFPLWIVFGPHPNPNEGDDDVPTRLFLLGAVAFLLWGAAILIAKSAPDPPIRVESGPSTVAYAPDGQHAFVSSSAADTVSEIDTETAAMRMSPTQGQAPSRR